MCVSSFVHDLVVNNGCQAPQQQQAQCDRCQSRHDRALPCFVQPANFPTQIGWIQCQQPQPQRQQQPPESIQGDCESDEGEEDAPSQQRRRKPVRFVFWDVESELLEDNAVEHWDSGEEEEEAEQGEGPGRNNRAAAPNIQRSHRPLLVCADVICERCIAAGIDLDREPTRRAPSCFCGVPWRDGDAGRRACMSVDRQLLSGGQMPEDGRNPRRLAFHRFHEQQQEQQQQQVVNSAIAQFMDFLLHTGPRTARTIALAHNGVGQGIG